MFATPQAQNVRDGSDPAQAPPDLQWARALVNAEGGALYMASTVVARTRATLLSLGMPADTPATWVANVSLPNQAVLQSTLGELKPLPECLAGQPAILLLGSCPPGTTAAAPQAVLPSVADASLPLSARFLEDRQDIHASLDS